MVNLAAFTSDLSEVSQASPVPELSVPGTLFDDADAVDLDGVLIPPQWRVNRDKWNNLPLSFRRKLAANEERRRLAREAKEARQAKRKARTGPTSTFSTQYAVEWGRRQGWKLIDRENFSHKTKRHHDLQLAVDVLMDDGGEGMIGIQGATHGQETEHRRKFEARGGEEKARRRHIRVVYVEFARGDKEPSYVNWWVA